MYIYIYIYVYIYIYHAVYMRRFQDNALKCTRRHVALSPSRLCTPPSARAQQTGARPKVKPLKFWRVFHRCSSMFTDFYVCVCFYRSRAAKTDAPRALALCGQLRQLQANVNNAPNASACEQMQATTLILYYNILYYTILYYTILYYTILYSMIYHTILCYTRVD